MKLIIVGFFPALLLGEISDSHGDEYEDDCLLRHCAV
jgi:hypothetical protein